MSRNGPDRNALNGCIANRFEASAWLIAVTVSHGDGALRSVTGVPLSAKTTQSFMTTTAEALV